MSAATVVVLVVSRGHLLGDFLTIMIRSLVVAGVKHCSGFSESGGSGNS